jgi:hypothetical protein
MEPTKKGAPTKYREAFNEEARLFCLLTGATDEQLAQHLNVAESTVKNWYHEYPDFLASVKAGKAGADMRVAEGLYKRATGYEYPSEKIVVVSNGGMDGSSVERVPITTVVIPDAGAALNWLKNRQPEHWRDKVEIAHSGKIDTSDMSNLSDDQLRKLLSDLEANLADEQVNP